MLHRKPTSVSIHHVDVWLRVENQSFLEYKRSGVGNVPPWVMSVSQELIWMFNNCSLIVPFSPLSRYLLPERLNNDHAPAVLFRHS